MFCSFNNKKLIRKSQQFFPRIPPHASNIPRVAIFFKSILLVTQQKNFSPDIDYRLQSLEMFHYFRQGFNNIEARQIKSFMWVDLKKLFKKSGIPCVSTPLAQPFTCKLDSCNFHFTKSDSNLLWIQTLILFLFCRFVAHVEPAVHQAYTR